MKESWVDSQDSWTAVKLDKKKKINNRNKDIFRNDEIQNM